MGGVPRSGFFEGQLSEEAMGLVREMLAISKDRPEGSMATVTLRQLAHRLVELRPTLSAIDAAAFMLAGSYVADHALRELRAEVETEAVFAKLKRG